MLNIIPDGYEEQGYIAAIDNLHSAVRFRFRPMSVDEFGQMQDWAKQYENSQGGFFRRIVTLLQRKVISWDVIDACETVLPITAENLLRLKPALLQRLYLIVAGSSPSDTDPTWSAEQQRQQAALVESAEINGTSVGAQRELADAKN